MSFITNILLQLNESNPVDSIEDYIPCCELIKKLNLHKRNCLALIHIQEANNVLETLSKAPTLSSNQKTLKSVVEILTGDFDDETDDQRIEKLSNIHDIISLNKETVKAIQKPEVQVQVQEPIVETPAKKKRGRKPKNIN
jgi:hypothetical protein